MDVAVGAEGRDALWRCGATLAGLDGDSQVYDGDKQPLIDVSGNFLFHLEPTSNGGSWTSLREDV